MSYKLAGVTWNDDGTMTTPLEALNKLMFDKSLDKIPSKEEEIEMFGIVKNALKALEIIRKKFVDIARLINSNNVDEYNKTHYDDLSLTKEEFDLLKEVLL